MLSNISFAKFLLYVLILIGISFIAMISLGVVKTTFFSDSNQYNLIFGALAILLPLYYTFNVIHQDCESPYYTK